MLDLSEFKCFLFTMCYYYSTSLLIQVTNFSKIVENKDKHINDRNYLTCTEGSRHW